MLVVGGAVYSVLLGTDTDGRAILARAVNRRPVLLVEYRVVDPFEERRIDGLKIRAVPVARKLDAAREA